MSPGPAEDADYYYPFYGVSYVWNYINKIFPIMNKSIISLSLSLWYRLDIEMDILLSSPFPFLFGLYCRRNNQQVDACFAKGRVLFSSSKQRHTMLHSSSMPLILGVLLLGIASLGGFVSASKFFISFCFGFYWSIRKGKYLYKYSCGGKTLASLPSSLG